MGEKIKNLSSFSVNGNKVAIELNNGYSEEYARYDIHLQSDAVQYSMSDKDFMKLVSCVATAKLQLEALKK